MNPTPLTLTQAMIQYAIKITNDSGFENELWGPYETQQLAEEVKAAFIGVPESAEVLPATTAMQFTGQPF